LATTLALLLLLLLMMMMMMMMVQLHRSIDNPLTINSQPSAAEPAG